MKIRAYQKEDAPALCRLFYETVQALGRYAYTPEQVAAWAPKIPDASAWHQRMSGRLTLVAEDAKGPAGFLELETSGHLDMLYCRADRIRRGVGTALYAAAEAQAKQAGRKRVFTEASAVARPFFLWHGFTELSERTFDRQTIDGVRVRMTNYAMEKAL